MQTIRKRRRRLTHLVAVLAATMAVIIAACAGAIVWIVKVSAASLDATQQQSERRLLRVVVETQQKTLGNALEDYTNWKELYDDLEGPPQPRWETDNLGPYLVTTFGVDHVFVAARNGLIVYTYSKEPNYRISPADSRAVAQLARLAFRIEPPARQKAAVGAITIHGEAALAATATVRATTFNAPSHYALIEMREFSPAYLHALGRDYGIVGLHTAAANAGIGLPAPDGRPSPFRLVWRPSAHGHALFMRALPTVLGAAAAALLAFAGLVFVWWRIAEHMRAGEARVLSAELEASRARVELAEETSRSKSAFIANMSHELRTPLNAIIGFSELISAEVLGALRPAKYRDYVQDIHASGCHLLQIVEDVLHVSRIEAGRFDPALERLRVGEAVAESLRMIEVLGAKRGISLGVSSTQEAKVLADRKALRQILINVLSNAVKFSPPHGSVEISWSARGAECAILVRDRGCGMPPEVLKDLGKPFVQAEPAYSRQYHGTGLGLAISFKLAEAMGGSIAVESKLGLGTTVIVRLPLAQVGAATGDQTVLAA